jgi:hypothetical protein
MHAMAKIAAAAITCRRVIGARSKSRRRQQREAKS